MPTKKAPTRRKGRPPLEREISDAELGPMVDKIIRDRTNQIVLTGLVHVEAGKALGRLCVCTSDSGSNETFFIGMKGIEANCPRCNETHQVTDFKTAASDGSIDLSEAIFCIGPRELLGSLFGIPNLVQTRRGVLREAATS